MKLYNTDMQGQRPESTRETFTVSAGVLHTTSDLYWELLEEFDAACNKLLECRKPVLEVDLLSVNFISSSFVGCLANLVLKASRRKKRVVLKVSEDISWLFDIMGGEKLMDTVVI